MRNRINLDEADAIQVQSDNVYLVKIDNGIYLTDSQGHILQVVDDIYYDINYAPQQKVEPTFESVLKQMLETYKAKNNDYGNSVQDTYDKFGDISFLTRINDKINRLNTLCVKGNQQVLDESINDTILDLANYAVLFYVIRNQ